MPYKVHENVVCVSEPVTNADGGTCPMRLSMRLRKIMREVENNNRCAHSPENVCCIVMEELRF